MRLLAQRYSLDWDLDVELFYESVSGWRALLEVAVDRIDEDRTGLDHLAPRRQPRTNQTPATPHNLL